MFGSKALSLSRAAISSSLRRRSFSSRTSLPRLWQYQKTKRRTANADCQWHSWENLQVWWGFCLRNSARDHSTFIPMNAGNLNLRKFIIARSMPATAPGFVTRSFRLGTFIFQPIFDAKPAAGSAYFALTPCLSAAAASISGPSVWVILLGSCSMSFCRNDGRWE